LPALRHSICQYSIIPVLMKSQKVKNTPSPLTGEGQGEGEELKHFAKLFIPSPSSPSVTPRREGEI
jgi:hypothetical protein